MEDPTQRQVMQLDLIITE
jgi:hypothetical protein